MQKCGGMVSTQNIPELIGLQYHARQGGRTVLLISKGGADPTVDAGNFVSTNEHRRGLPDR